MFAYYSGTRQQALVGIYIYNFDELKSPQIKRRLISTRKCRDESWASNSWYMYEYCQSCCVLPLVQVLQSFVYPFLKNAFPKQLLVNLGYFHFHDKTLVKSLSHSSLLSISGWEWELISVKASFLFHHGRSGYYHIVCS